MLPERLAPESPTRLRSTAGVTQHESGQTKPAKSVILRLLGPMSLEIDGRSVAVARPQVRQAITALASAAGRSASADVLIEELWPDALPVNPRKSLNVVMSRLRAALGPDDQHLVTVGDGYRLDAVDLDLEAFIDKIDTGRHTSGRAALTALTEALAMWRGTPLTDLHGPSGVSRRSSLAEHRWFAITRLTELLIEEGHEDRAAALALAHVGEQPARERLVLACARALAHEGRKSEALRVLQRCAAVLRDEQGIEPSTALRRVERSILDGAVELTDSTQQRGTPVEHVFVGRSDELEMLSAMANVRSIVVEGEAGIGKSRLLAHANSLWHAQDLNVVVVSVHRSPDRPLDAIAQLCSALLRSAPEWVDEFGSTLARVCPEVELPAPDVALTRDAVFANVAEFIERAASNTVVVIDDVHWLDSGSMEVLRTVMSRAAVRIVVAMRPTDHPKLDFFRAATADTEVIRLRPLDRSEVSDLVAIATSGRRADDVGARIAARSGGNALFVRLLLDCWLEGAEPDSELPTDVLVAVTERLDALAQRTVDSLQVAAVVGNVFGLHTLRQLRSHVDTDLEHASAAGLIRLNLATDQGEFVHGLVGDACYELLSPGRRVVLHDDVGRVLEGDGAAAAEFAPHYLLAAELDPRRAVAALIGSAAEFAMGFDWEAAEEQLAEAGDLAHRLNVRDAAIDAELSVRRGIVGRALASDRYLDDLISGAKQAKEIGDHALVAVAVAELCGHGRSTGAISVDEQIAGLLDDALALDLPPDHRAELCASGSVLLAVTNHTDRGRALYHEAHDLALELGDVEIEASVLEHAHLGLAHPDDFGLLRAAGWRLGELAGNDPGLRWESAFLRFQTSVMIGDVEQVTEAMAEMREWTPLVKQRARDFGMSFSEVAYAQLRGDLELAEKHAGTTLEVGLARYPKSWAMNVYSLLLMSIRREQGRLSELHGGLDAAIGQAPDFMPYRVSAAAFAHAAGDTKRAASEADFIWTKGLAALPFDGYWTSFAVLLTEPTIASRDVAEVEELGMSLGRASGRLSWNGASSGGPVDAALALISETLRDPSRAAQLRLDADDLVARLRAV